MFGPHLVLEGYGCKNKAAMENPDLMRKILTELPSVMDMHIIMEPKIMYYDGGEIPQDKGVSGFVIIAESHIAIHTFPEKGFFTLDIFSCKDFDVELAKDFVNEFYMPERCDEALFNRGREFPRSYAKATDIVSAEREAVCVI